MAQLYTLEQLSDANLPGFQESATLQECLFQKTDWQTVLSLTILSEAEDGGLQVLSGIRREDTNFTHPGVVSTPTGRLPRRIAHQLIRSKYDNLVEGDTTLLLESVNPQRPGVIAHLSSNQEKLPNSEAVLPFVTAALLAGKLGCSAAIENATTEAPIGTVSLESLIGGFSYASDTKEGEPLFEPLIMFGATVTLKDPSIIPETTEAYRRNSWISLDTFKKGYASRKANLLIPSITPEEEVAVCVRGLCLATSGENIADEERLRQHLDVGGSTT